MSDLSSPSPAIEQLHHERLTLHMMMSEALRETSLSEYNLRYRDLFLVMCDELYTVIEFELQKEWGFDPSANYHHFWSRPGCLCPKMDNEERFGCADSVISQGCPLHGGLSEAPPVQVDDGSMLRGFCGEC